MPITVNSCIFITQISGILIQPARISKKIYNVYKVIQEQICDAHILTCYMVILPGTTACFLPHTTAIIAGGS
jgi:hypothetical protein